MITYYDSELNNITPSLLMLPWIGENYETKKVLFIGESDYGDITDFHRHWKREWIQKERINATMTDAKLLNNIDNTILINKSPESQRNLWNAIAYTNLVQRPMKDLGDHKEKPKYNDILEGWEAMLEVLLILKPITIIKWGILGDGILRGRISQGKYTDWKYENIDNNQRFLMLKHKSGFETRLIFTHHPSSYYSPAKWKEIIYKNLPELKSSLN